MAAFDVIFKAFLLTLWIFDSVKAQITCSEPGLFPLKDITCQYYYECSFNGFDFSPQIFKCPDNTVFDPNRQTCVLPTQYVCIEASTTVDPYQCLTAGRFPIADPTCQQYYLCYWNTNGYVRRIFKCPNQTIFDPTRQLCVLRTAYVCGGTVDPTCIV